MNHSAAFARISHVSRYLTSKPGLERTEDCTVSGTVQARSGRARVGRYQRGRDPEAEGLV